MEEKFNIFPYLCRKIVKEGRVAASVIDSYNSFLFKDVKNIMNNMIIPLNKDGSIFVKFEGDPIYEPPEYFPNEIRISHGYYTSILKYKIKEYKRERINDRGIEKIIDIPISESENPIALCHIPVMIGSKIDKLTGLTKDQLVEHGESRDDPGGYFIMGGEERLLMMQEGVKPRYPIMYENPKNRNAFRGVEIKYTSGETYGGLNSSVFKLFATSELTLKCEFSKSIEHKMAPINILHIFYVLLDRYIPLKNKNRSRLNDPNEFGAFVTEFIQRFVIDENESRLIARKNKIAEVIGVTLSEITSGTQDQNKFGKTYEFLKILFDSKTVNKEVIESIIIGDLFKNANFLKEEKQIRAKIRTLSHICCKYIDMINGVREVESRDDWAFKRITTSGEHMRSCFASGWSQIRDNIIKNIGNEKMDLNFFYGKLSLESKNSIDNRFVSAFRNQAWDTHNATKRELNIVEPLNKHNKNNMDHLSGLSVIQIGGSKKGGGDKKRLIHQTQYGFICPVTTPENTNCGTIKDHTICARITSESDPAQIFNLLQESDLFYDEIKVEDEDFGTVFINGICVGYARGGYGKNLKNMLVDQRRKCNIPRETSIILTEQNELLIYTDSGRVIRPVMPINQETKEYLLVENNMINEDNTYDDFFKNGSLEFIDTMETKEYMIIDDPCHLYLFDRAIKSSKVIIKNIKNIFVKESIVRTIKELSLDNVDKKYHEVLVNLQDFFRIYSNDSYPEYGEISPSMVLGVVPNMNIAFLAHSGGPRISYHTNMSKQALSVDISNMSPEAKRRPRVTMLLKQGDVQIVHTNIGKALGMDTYPCGRNVICAFMVFDSLNMEDSIVFNKRSIQNGLFHTEHYFGYHSERTTTSGATEIFGVPDELPPEDKARFTHIVNEPGHELEGLPYLGTYLQSGQPIIAKFIRTPDGKYADKSTYVKFGEQGKVDLADKIRSIANSSVVARVRLVDYRIPEDGDKFVTSPSQKGVVGKIVDEELIPHIVSDDPFVNGVKPDIIFNPHGLITRMTVGKVYEAISALIALRHGRRVQSDAFDTFDAFKIKEMLSEAGYPRGGSFKMFDPQTRTVTKKPILVGPIHYSVLKHFTYTVTRARGRGQNDPISRQPKKGNTSNKGVAIGGPYKVSFMDVNVFISFGVSSVLRERNVLSSDPFNVAICECGRICLRIVGQALVVCPIHSNKKNIYKTQIPYALMYINHMMTAIGIDFRTFPKASNLLENEQHRLIME